MILRSSGRPSRQGPPSHLAVGSGLVWLRGSCGLAGSAPGSPGVNGKPGSRSPAPCASRAGAECVCVCARVCARVCMCVCVCVTRTYIGWGIFFFSSALSTVRTRPPTPSPPARSRSLAKARSRAAARPEPCALAPLGEPEKAPGLRESCASVAK